MTGSVSVCPEKKLHSKNIASNNSKEKERYLCCMVMLAPSITI